MQAVRLYGRRDLRVETVAAPSPPEPGCVRLRVLAAGICGSDLHNFETGRWLTVAPVTPGHELMGVVEDFGDGVVGLSRGDHVVADSRVWCGGCAMCRAGRRHLCEHLGFVGEVCDGGFAEAVVLPSRLLHKVDRSIEPRVAAMTEPLAVALHAAGRLRPVPGAPVLVVGCGTIGGLAALVLSRRHDGRVLVADRTAARAELVSRVTGATVVDLEAACVEAAAAGRPVVDMIEATGSVEALRAAMDCLGPGARMALVGIFHARLDLDPNWLVEREATFLGCHAFADEMSEAISLLPALSADLVQLIEAEIDLADVPAAYARLASGGVTGLKTIVAPGSARRLSDPA